MELIFGKEHHNEFKLETFEVELQKLKKYKDKGKIGKGVWFNFSQTRWFSAGSLLFLIVVIDFLKKDNIPVKIIPPYKSLGEKGPEPAKKARDFLKRWRFLQALKFYFGDDKQFFEKEHQDYLTEPQIYYIRKKELNENGDLTELYSLSVIEISRLIQKKEDPYNRYRIEQYLSNYADKRIEKLLKNGIDFGTEVTRSAIEDFIKDCIREPLENALDHAEANIGFITAQISEKYFNITIADNGKGIPKTIELVYRTLKGEDATDAELIKYAFSLREREEVQMILAGIKKVKDAGLIELAHIKGVTRSPKTHTGEGLYRLKEFVEKSRGYFIVRSRAGSVLFDARNGKIKSNPKTCVDIPGTFISIYLSRKKES